MTTARTTPPSADWNWKVCAKRSLLGLAAIPVIVIVAPIAFLVACVIALGGCLCDLGAKVEELWNE